MGGVRTLASVFWWLSWAVLILAVLEAIALFQSVSSVLGPLLGRNSGLVALGAASVALIIAGLQSLLPFFAWGVLTALTELNDPAAGGSQFTAAAQSRRSVSSPRQPATLVNAPDAPKGWAVAAMGADVLDKPSEDGARLGRLNITDAFQVLGHIDNPSEGVGYYKVRVGTVEGFVVDVRLARR